MTPPAPGVFDDPYAAIRTLNFQRGNEIQQALTQDEMDAYRLTGGTGVDGGGGGWDLDAMRAAGIAFNPDATDVSGSALPGARGTGRYEYMPGFDFYSDALRPFQSKYNNIRDLGNGRVSVRMQQPGGHKYDTMDVVYRQGPDGQWTMEGDPTPTREVSTGERWRDTIEPFLALGGAMGAAYLGGTALAGEGAAGAAAGEAAGSSLGAAGGGAGAADVAALGGAGGAGGTAAAGGGAGGAAGGGAAGAGGSSLGGAMDWSWVGPVASAVLQDRAASNAAGDQRAATEAAIAEQRRQYDQTREDYAPYREAGVGALGQLQTELGQPLTAQQVMQEPGYQFGMDEGMRALTQRIAAMGGRVSGNALRAASEYGTNYATTRYNDAHQRRMDRIRSLQSMAGLSQNAVSGGAAAGANATNAIGGAIQGQGDANAAARIGRGNIWANAGNQLWAMYGNPYGTNRPQSQGGYSGQPGWGSDAQSDPYYQGP